MLCLLLYLILSHTPRLMRLLTVFLRLKARSISPHVNALLAGHDERKFLGMEYLNFTVIDCTWSTSELFDFSRSMEVSQLLATCSLSHPWYIIGLPGGLSLLHESLCWKSKAKLLVYPLDSQGKTGGRISKDQLTILFAKRKSLTLLLWSVWPGDCF